MKKIYSLFILLVFIVSSSAAQQFTHKALLNQVAKKAYCKIHVPNSLRQFAGPDLYDVRILDEKNKQVPYKVSKFITQLAVNSIEPLQYVNNNNTEFIIEKGDKPTWSQVVLKIKNSAVTKQYTVSGSNDKKKWFALTDTSNLTLYVDNQEVAVNKVIDFPLVDYNYIKINIDNSTSVPLNVLSIGYSTSEVIANTLDKIQPFTFTVANDSIADKTTIHIRFEQAQQIDQMKLYVTGPSYYVREANLYKIVSNKYKNKTVQYNGALTAFQIRSKTNLMYDVNLFENDFYIEIANYDNEPLQIDSINFYQNPYYLAAELAPNNNYTIQCGDNNLNTPIYDIANFHELDASILPEVLVGETIDLRLPQNQIIAIKPFYEQQWFMWACIGVGILALGLFSASLLKDVKK
ncbi:MAG: hypothetical protein V4538_04940 [Bacteroidota bacterium]